MAAPVFARAQSQVSQQDLEAYYQKKMHERAVTEATVTSAALALKYGGSKETEKRLYAILINHTNEADILFAKLKGAVLNDSLTVLTLKTDSLIRSGTGGGTRKALPASVFTRILQYKAGLSLTLEQTTALTNAAVQLDKSKREFVAKNPGKAFNSQPIESTARKILSEKQYQGYLLAKNMPTATNWAKGDWADLKNLGLSNGLDSAKVVTEIRVFDARRLMVKQFYADNAEKLSVALDDLERTRPEVLKQIRSAKAHGNPTGQNAKSGSFAW